MPIRKYRNVASQLSGRGSGFEPRSFIFRGWAIVLFFVNKKSGCLRHAPPLENYFLSNVPFSTASSLDQAWFLPLNFKSARLRFDKAGVVQK